MLERAGPFAKPIDPDESIGWLVERSTASLSSIGGSREMARTYRGN